MIIKMYIPYVLVVSFIICLSVWVCAKCFEVNATSDSLCEKCGEPKKRNDSSAKSRNKGLGQCSQCSGETDSPKGPCANCCKKEKRVADVDQKAKPTHVGIENRELRIILLGKTGAGKSATGNTLLKQDLFRSEASMTSVTTKCQYKRTERWGQNNLIVDTPGLFDTSMTKEMISKEIKKSIAIAAPGPHVFLLVISMSGRFTKQEQDVLKELHCMFGGNMMKYLIVIFTCRDQIQGSIEAYVERCPDQLKQLLRDAGGGYITFNNKADAEIREDDAGKLYKRMVKMGKKNKGTHFSSESFREAEEILQETIARDVAKKEPDLRTKIEQELRKEMEEIMRKERVKLKKLHVATVRRVEKMKLEVKTEREKTTETPVMGQESKNVLGELVYEEMERNEKKSKLFHQMEISQGAERARIQQQLAGVGEEIKQIIAKRKMAEEEVTQERVATAVGLQALTSREDARQKVEMEDENTLSRITTGIKNLGLRFLQLFQ